MPETGDSNGPTRSEYTKPPEFLVDKSNFKQYKRDLERWLRCTTVEKKKQGDVILLNIPASHKLKERLEMEVGDSVIDNAEGAKLILTTLESIYGDDEVLECYLRFRELELKQRTVGQDILEYISEWETVYGRAKDRGVTLEEKCKALKLLMTACLDELDMKLVLSEIDMKTDEGKKKLYEQVKTAMRKYHGAGALNSHKNTAETLFNDTP